MSDNTEETIAATEEKVAKAEAYFENNSKTLTYVIVGLVVAVLGYFGFMKFIIEPKEKDAQAQMFVAVRYFEMDSLNLAINGDGNYIGFETIVSDYGMTKAANLAEYYLGIAYLKKGEFEKAIEHLEKFDSNDEMLQPIATGAIGDAYAELNNMEEAAKYYTKAASVRENDLTSPIYLMKAGNAYSGLGKHQDALTAYEKVKHDFPKSSQAMQADKYISLSKSNIK